MFWLIDIFNEARLISIHLCCRNFLHWSLSDVIKLLTVYKLVGGSLNTHWSNILARSLDYSLFIYLGFYVTSNTIQVISRRVVGRAEETSTFSWSGFCTVNCRQVTTSFPTWGRARNQTLASEVGGESGTTLPPYPPWIIQCNYI